MFDVSNLSSVTNAQTDPSNFWWIDRKLLAVEFKSFESLAMSAPVTQKLLESLANVTKDLINKSEYVFTKTKDVFGYRLKLEQMYRTVKDTNITWASLENVEVLGFDFTSCQTKLVNMTNMSVHIGTSIQRTPIEIVDETPNLSDDDIVSSVNDLKVTVNANKVKFFGGTTKKSVMTAVEDIISFDKSLESMGGYSGRVVEDSKTFDKPIKELTKNETVEINDIHAAVDSVNNRITTVNHLLNAMFLLQTYNKVMNVVFTDAISNLKEG